MFEKASRLKLKYDTVKGNVTTDDLWDMLLISNDGFCLDDLAKSLNRQSKENQEESFVMVKSAKDNIIELKFEIVKHVIKIKLEEKEQAENAVLKKAKKERILSLIVKKKNEEDESKSVEDLESMLEDL